MARVARNIVEFPIDGVIYEAKFQHAHADRDSKGKLLTNLPYHEGGRVKAIPVQHITTCFLRRKFDHALVVRGTSTCSLKESYKWRKGIKLAFQRALCKMGIATEIETVTVGPDKVERKSKRIAAIASQRDRYGRFMQTFFKELRIRETPPEASPVPARREIPITSMPGYPAIPPVQQPPYHMCHGLGHVGSD